MNAEAEHLHVSLEENLGILLSSVVGARTPKMFSKTYFTLVLYILKCRTERD